MRVWLETFPNAYSMASQRRPSLRSERPKLGQTGGRLDLHRTPYRGRGSRAAPSTSASHFDRGLRHIEIVFEGAADRAGMTPMDRRRDTLVAGAAMVSAERARAEELAKATGGNFVATMAVSDIEPGVSTVIPRRCRNGPAAKPSLTARQPCCKPCAILIKICRRQQGRSFRAMASALRRPQRCAIF